jgi:arabinose-5-phosphate isomerase
MQIIQKTTRERSLNTLKQELLALENLRDTIMSDSFGEAVNIMQNVNGKIIFTALGKSSFVAQKISATFVSLGINSACLHPVDAFHGDIGNVNDGDVVMAISSSGETKEILKLVNYIKFNFNSKVICLTSNESSSLAQNSDVCLKVEIQSEGCPIDAAPMASAVATLALGDCLAAALTDPEVFGQEKFAKYHPGGNLGLAFTCVDRIMKTGESVPLINSDLNFRDLLSSLDSYMTGVVGVTNSGGELVGVITDGDLRRFIQSNDNLISKKARDISSPSPICIGNKCSLKEALTLMKEKKITSLFITEGEPNNWVCAYA